MKASSQIGLRRSIVPVILTILACSPHALAVRMVGGKEPVSDPGWPDGVLAVANLASRHAYSPGDTAFIDTDTFCEFFYRGDTAAFQDAIDTLAQVRAPVKELVLHDTPATHWMGVGSRSDWIFTVWKPEGWHRVYGQHPITVSGPGDRSRVAPPRIDVYLSTTAPKDGIDFNQIVIPAGVRVIDERIASQKVQPVGGAMLRGTVYDMATGKTIAGATIEAQPGARQDFQPGPKVQSGESGAYELDKLPAGPYRLVVSAKGYAPRVVHQNLDLRTGTYKEIDALLSAAVTLLGSVTDESGKPVPKIQVWVTDATGIDGLGYGLPARLMAHTDADGKFTFAEMPEGFARFSCTGQGYRQLDRTMLQAVHSWQRGIPNSTIRTGQGHLTLLMAIPGRVRVKVPAGPISVASAEGGYSMGRDRMMFNLDVSGGVAESSELPPGRYFVARGHRVDLDPNARIVTVTSGQTTEVDLTEGR